MKCMRTQTQQCSKWLVRVIQLVLFSGGVTWVHSQGTIWFSNRFLPQVDAPIFHTGCQTPLAGMAYQAGLYAGVEGAIEPELVVVGPPSFFRIDQGAGYFIAQDMVVPFLTPGETGTFQVRVWESAAGSFEAAQAGGGLYGKSGIVTVRLTGSLVGIPDDLTGLQSFCLVPEPAPVWLWAGGGIVLRLLTTERTGALLEWMKTRLDSLFPILWEPWDCPISWSC
jgi:hypothetical protein